MVAVFSLTLATVLWLVALLYRESSLADVGQILGWSALVAGVCLAIQGVISIVTRSVAITTPLVFAHFLQGLLVFVTYTVAYIFSPDWFLKSWRSIYFGYYLYDICVILLCWRRFVGSFRTFYAVHHTLSFCITALWMFFGGEWLDYIILGVMIWLASDVWVYLLSMYRCLWGRGMPRARVVRLQITAFCLERIHRLTAYGVPFVIADYQLSPLAVLVFCTGVVNDILDAVFQWRGIQRKQRVLKRARSR